MSRGAFQKRFSGWASRFKSRAKLLITAETFAPLFRRVA
jgi:hypothetical protein